MKELIQKLLDEKKELSERINKIDIAIKSLRELCPHDKVVPSGHDSHYKFMKCINCNIEVKC